MAQISIGSENIWSFLLLSGYLKVNSKFRNEDEEFIYNLTIPNKEIKYFYKDIIKNWAQEGFIDSEFKKMLSALTQGDIKKAGIIFEFKRYDKEDEETIEEMLDSALNQIEEKKYDVELKNRGVEEIIKLGIVFNGKEVHIRKKD